VITKENDNPRLLHVDYTDAVHQLLQRRLFPDLNLDKTVRRDTFIQHAPLRSKQQCTERLLQLNDQPQGTHG
jgi:hypothetical protein